MSSSWAKIRLARPNAPICRYRAVLLHQKRKKKRQKLLLKRLKRTWRSDSGSKRNRTVNCCR